MNARALVLVAVLAGTAALAGCFEPDLGNTPFMCSTVYQIDCPEGYRCYSIDYGGKEGKQDICIPEDKLPPDLGTPDRKMMSDAEILPKKEGPVYLDGAIVQKADNCADKDSEPNNSAGTATALQPKSRQSPGWEICYPFDIDQFSIPLKTGETLTVKVKFTHSKGDLDAALADPDGYIRSSSRGTSDTEEVSYKAEKDGKHYIGVWGAAQTPPLANPATNTYDLDIDIQ